MMIVLRMNQCLLALENNLLKDDGRSQSREFQVHMFLNGLNTATDTCLSQVEARGWETGNGTDQMVKDGNHSGPARHIYSRWIAWMAVSSPGSLLVPGTSNSTLFGHRKVRRMLACLAFLPTQCIFLASVPISADTHQECRHGVMSSSAIIPSLLISIVPAAGRRLDFFYSRWTQTANWITETTGSTSRLSQQSMHTTIAFEHSFNLNLHWLHSQIFGRWFGI